MKAAPMEDATLDHWVVEAQHERVILTRNGHPIALVVGVDGLDEERIRLGGRPEFWELIEKSRGRKTMSRQELERRLGRNP